MSVDPNELARNELAAAMIPTPDDVMTDLSPLAGLFYLEQLGWAVLTSWAAFASDAATTDPEAGDDLAQTLAQVGGIVGMLDATCARIGLIPADAVPPS